MQQKLLEFYYKWNKFEKKNNIDIIDFDLLQQGDQYSEEFCNREEVLETLLKLIEEYKKLKDKNLFIESKLEAALYYLNALMGKKSTFKEYIEKTMGLTPIFIPETVLNEQKEKTQEAYKELGYSWNEQGIEKYKRDNLLNTDDIEKTFIKFKDNTIPKVLDWLGLNMDLQYETSFVDLDVYWMNWISTDNIGQIHLQYNINKRHKWVKGSTEFLVLHEICAHAIQVNCWKSNIQKNKIEPFIGLTSVFTPEQFSMEGIAGSLFYFYPTNPFSIYGLISLHSNHLHWMVWNNAHIMANEGEKTETVIDFIQTYLPELSEESIKKMIKEKTEDPLFRTYQYIYGIALYYNKLISEKLNSEEKRNYVLDIFNNVYRPEDILKKYSL